MTTTTVKRRVKAGIKELDRELPPRWREKINLATLDIASTNSCVLGQLYGNYGTGCQELGLSNDKSRAFGFLGQDDMRDYDKLNEAWKLALSS